MEHAVHIWNNLPNHSYNVEGGLCPLEIFSKAKVNSHHLQQEKTWGCPAYVLDPRLQDAQKIPKWDHRTRLGQYLGKSEKHASSVGLIRNLRTGYISPQFHVVYDKKIQTVIGGDENNDVIVDHIWSNLGGEDSMLENVVDPVDTDQQQIPQLHTSWLTDNEKE